MRANSDFQQEVVMWVFQEQVDGKNLTDIINETHENVKYLKGFSLPSNVVSLLEQTRTCFSDSLSSLL